MHRLLNIIIKVINSINYRVTSAMLMIKSPVRREINVILYFFYNVLVLYSTVKISIEK